MNSARIANFRLYLLALRTLFALTVAAIVAATPGYGITTYSGASAGSNGTVYGWRVTDAYVGAYMTHTAYVTTTLRSPSGRLSSSGWQSATNYVRADVSLGWNATDLGNYTVESTHKAFCIYMGWFILNQITRVAFAFPFSAAVTITTWDGPESCGVGSAGHRREVRMEVRDQTGLPIRKSGILMADVIQIASPNDLGIVGAQTDADYTDSSGRWPDLYYVCSTACPGSTGQTKAFQYWRANGVPLPHVNVIVYKENYII